MNILTRFRNVKSFVFDIDGVLTDGSLLIDANGQWLRKMSTRDGYALQLAIKYNYRVVVISGSESTPVEIRLRKLGVTEIFMKVNNKEDFLKDYLSKNDMVLSDTLFMGDDIPDLLAMRHVGLACAPADAAPEIRHIAAYISSFNGGHGCVRDVIEKVLKLNGHWDFDSSVASK